MCFSIPRQIKSIKNNNALVEGGLQVKLGTVDAAPGDYLLVYGNMAVEKVTKKKAIEFRKLVSKTNKL